MFLKKNVAEFQAFCLNIYIKSTIKCPEVILFYSSHYKTLFKKPYYYKLPNISKSLVTTQQTSPRNIIPWI